MKFLAVKKFGNLHPLYESSLFKIKEGETVEIEVKRSRNIGFHRKFFAMLNLCFDNQEVFDNIEYFREELLKASGYFNKYINHKGIECYKAKSISFANMSQDEFETLYESFLVTVIQVFNWSDVESEIRKELNEF